MIYCRKDKKGTENEINYLKKSVKTGLNNWSMNYLNKMPINLSE
jgi:hypothetical protein